MKSFALKSITALTLISIGLGAQGFWDNDKEKKWALESEKNTIEVFDKSVGSIVNVSNIRKIRQVFFGLDLGEQKDVPAGSGTGFVWDDEGHIVTNFHVVQDSSEIKVSFHNDKKQYSAKVIGVEPRKDIAVLKLIDKPKKLIPSNIGSSHDLRVGQKAIAIGSPFGLDHTMTAGIISALNRKNKGVGGVDIHGMVQTDASINPGNSGGPLLDSKGRVIGMNTMIYSKSGSSAGIGFAVPVDTIKRVAPQLIRYGKVKRPGIGVALMNDGYRAFLGIAEGVIISDVPKGTPAYKAGLRGSKMDRRSGQVFVGDVIIKIDGKKVNSFNDIYNVLDLKNIGEEVTVSYLRKGREKSAKIKLIDIEKQK